MTRTFQLTYDTWGATLEIDPDKALPYMRATLEFFDATPHPSMDVAELYVEMLAPVLLEVSHELGSVVDNMKKVEGFHPLDGSCGILLKACDHWSFDVDVHVCEKKETVRP